MTPPEVPEDRVPAFHKYRVQLDATKVGVDAPPAAVRDAMLRALRAEGCEVVLWQTKAVPGQTLFQKMGVPAYDLARYPVTRDILDRSLVLFSQTYPLAPQPRPVVEACAEAFARVWTRLPEVLAR